MQIGFFGLLTLLLVALKLTGFITWSWWFIAVVVLMPLWIVLMAIVAGVLAGLIAALTLKGGVKP